MTGAPMTDPHAEVRTPSGWSLEELRARVRRHGQKGLSVQDCYDLLDMAGQRRPTPDPSGLFKEVEDFLFKIGGQGYGGMAEYESARAAFLNLRHSFGPTSDPSGAEEMREAAAKLVEKCPTTILEYQAGKGDVHRRRTFAEIAEAIRALPIPRPSTGGTDGKSPEAIAEDIVSQVAVNEYQAHRLADLIATALREDRASRATTEARMGELAHTRQRIAEVRESWKLSGQKMKVYACDYLLDYVFPALTPSSSPPDTDWKARAEELAELVRTADTAITAAYLQADAEWRSHDRVAGRYDDDVRAWREKARAALASATQPQADKGQKTDG